MTAAGPFNPQPSIFNLHHPLSAHFVPIIDELETRSGDPHNAVLVLGKLCRQLLPYLTDQIFTAKLATEQAVYLYNCERPHLALNMRVPAEVHFAKY